MTAGLASAGAVLSSLMGAAAGMVNVVLVVAVWVAVAVSVTVIWVGAMRTWRWAAWWGVGVV